jgi:replicative DNA helicase
MSDDALFYSAEAEQAVLGAVMQASMAGNDGMVDDIIGMVSTADFFHDDHASLLDVFVSCRARGLPIDPVTASYDRDALPSGQGTLGYAATLAKDVPSSANWKAYALRIKQLAVLRTIDELGPLARRMRGEEAPPAEIIAVCQQAMSDLRDLESGERDFKRIDEVVTRNIDIIDSKFNGSVPSGLSTGLEALDEMVRGLRKKTVTIVAGLPGSGKTTLGLQIAQHVACQGLGTGMVFSLEMPEEELGNRILASLGTLDMKRLDDGKLTDEDWPKLTSAVNQVLNKPLYICDRSNLTVAKIRSIARQVQREHGLDVVVIDYIGLIKSEGKAFNRTAELGAISTGIVNIAKELDVPVILLAQLNRDSTKRPGKKPIASDLRDSGQIEADAHCIILVHRDIDTEAGQNGVTELIMPKCRHAPVGSRNVMQQGQFARFVDMDAKAFASYGDEEESRGSFASRAKGRSKS